MYTDSIFDGGTATYFYVLFSLAIVGFIHEYVGKRDRTKVIHTSIDQAGALACFWLVTHISVVWR